MLYAGCVNCLCILLEIIIQFKVQSSKSAKRDRAPCLEERSAIVRAPASERELDLFHLLEIESSDVILARTFQGGKLSQGTQAVKNYFSRVL